MPGGGSRRRAQRIPSDRRRRAASLGSDRARRPGKVPGDDGRRFWACRRGSSPRPAFRNSRSLPQSWAAAAPLRRGRPSAWAAKRAMSNRSVVTGSCGSGSAFLSVGTGRAAGDARRNPRGDRLGWSGEWGGGGGGGWGRCGKRLLAFIGQSDAGRQRERLSGSGRVRDMVRMTGPSSRIASIIALFIMPILAHAKIVVQTVEYKDGDVTLWGYLAYDDAAKDARRASRLSSGGVSTTTPSGPKQVARLELRRVRDRLPRRDGKVAETRSRRRSGRASCTRSTKKTGGELMQPREGRDGDAPGPVVRGGGQVALASIGFCLGGTSSIELAQLAPGEPQRPSCRSGGSRNRTWRTPKGIRRPCSSTMVRRPLYLKGRVREVQRRWTTRRWTTRS